MPLLERNKSEEELALQENWFAVRRFVKKNFDKRPDINAILFLIGMNEIGVVKETFEKEEKQDLMHVAICTIFEPEGYFNLEYKDDDGWPHYNATKALPKIHLKEQEGLLKEKIIAYFKKNQYI